MKESETISFKILCIDGFSRKHSMTVPDTIVLFDRYGVFEFMDIPAMRWQFLENAILDIEEFIEVRSWTDLSHTFKPLPPHFHSETTGDPFRRSVERWNPIIGRAYSICSEWRTTRSGTEPIASAPYTPARMGPCGDAV